MFRVLALVLLLPSTALAWAPAAQVQRLTKDSSTNDFNLLEGVALNATAALRTITVPIAQAKAATGEGYEKLVVVVDFTYNAATTVVLTPTCSIDGGSTYASETSTAITAGAGSVSIYADTYTTGAASAVFRVVYDVAGCTHYKIVFSGASAGASDLVDVQAALTVGE
jgi:hypothetical protein